MWLRRPHDLAAVFRDGRSRLGWSQNDLAEAIGVSRQWISLVERGKTSVEFDLVMAALQALGYRLHAEAADRTHTVLETDYPSGAVHEPSQRTRLTRHGRPLRGPRRSRPEGNRHE